jgi:hypothetical protein
MSPIQLANQLALRLTGELGVTPSDVDKHSKELAKAVFDGDVIVITDLEKGISGWTSIAGCDHARRDVFEH